MKIHLDFETQSAADLKRCGAAEYARHPSTRVLCLAIGVGSNVQLMGFDSMQLNFDELPSQMQLNFIRFATSDEFVFYAHNAFFEQSIYNEILVKRLGYPKIKISKWRCTAAKAAAVAIPRNLADAGAVMNLRIQKDYEGHRVMLKLCKPTAAWAKWKKANDDIKSGKRVLQKTRELAEREEPIKFHTPETDPDDFKTLYHYCKIDVQTETLLDKALPDLTPFEQKVWFADQRMNHRGVAVDMQLVNKIAEIMESEAKTMNETLDELTMGLVSSGNQRAAILDFMHLEGIEMPDLRAATVDDFLENGKVTGDAEKILKIRKALAKSSTAKYKTFQIRAASDGRVRDLLLFLGAARTGRWGGKGIQPQNFPRGVIKDIYAAIDDINRQDVGMLKMLYGENLMPLFSSVLRGMFIASPGHELFVEDYNAIECRVAWYLAGHEDGLNMFRQNRDPYVEMASAIYNKLPSTITADERQVGKAATLGCSYQMGGKKFVTSAWDVYRAKVTKELGKLAVSIYRDVHYPVTEMWEAYNSAAISAIENRGEKYRVGKIQFYVARDFMFIELPSGRRLAYASPKVVMATTKIVRLKDETNYAGNDLILAALLAEGGKVTGEFQSKRMTYMEVNQKAKKEECLINKWAVENTYGGKLFENVVQAVSRDLLAAAILRVEKAGFKPLMHSHDELVSEAPKGLFKIEDYRKLMEQVPKWAEGLPLKTSGWTGVRYRKG
jgi:DNA polymerase